MMTNFKVPVYPDDFYIMNNAVKIDNKTINNWIQDCIKGLEENPNEVSWSISSGDTLVIVFRGNKEDGIKYDITVSKNHADTMIFE